VKKLLTAIPLLWLGTGAVFSQAAPVESIFLPPRFFVGDRVELRLRYEVPAGLAVEPPEQTPEHAWIEFRDIQVQDRRAAGRSGEVLVRIFFVPFYPGEAVLPSIPLGELSTAEIPVATRSTLQVEEDRSFRGPRGQLTLPLTWLKLLGLLMVGAGVPMSLYFLIRYGILGLIRFREVRVRRLPYLHVRKNLKRLTAQMPDMEGKSFFILLSLAVRRYLTERLEEPLMSVTTGEIAEELSRAGLEEDLIRSIHEVLNAADLIKFSGKRASKPEMRRSLRAVDQIVEQVEERTADVES
jgi:hypothetical protein